MELFGQRVDSPSGHLLIKDAQVKQADVGLGGGGGGGGGGGEPPLREWENTITTLGCDASDVGCRTVAMDTGAVSSWQRCYGNGAVCYGNGTPTAAVMQMSVDGWRFFSLCHRRKEARCHGNVILLGR